MDFDYKFIRVAIRISIAWIVLIFALVAIAVLREPSFDQVANRQCSQFVIPLAEPVEKTIMQLKPGAFVPIVRWVDEKSKERITPFRRNEQSLTCREIEARAMVFKAGAAAGLIKPKVDVDYLSLLAVLILPCALITVVALVLFRAKR